MLKGRQFDIGHSDDHIQIDHHERERRLRIARDGDKWVVQTGPCDEGNKLEEHGTVDDRAAAWDVVIEWIDSERIGIDG